MGSTFRVPDNPAGTGSTFRSAHYFIHFAASTEHPLGPHFLALYTSSSQFTKTTIGDASVSSTGFSARNRWPSGATSNGRLPISNKAAGAANCSALTATDVSLPLGDL